MKLRIILFLAVIILAACKPFQLEATPTPIPSRAHLLHSKVLLDYWSAHLNEGYSLRRHNLETYEQVPLTTDHYGFKLKVIVAGIEYNLGVDTGSSDIFIKGEKRAPGLPKIRYISGENYLKNRVIRIGYLDGELQTYEKTLSVEFDNKKFDVPLLVAYTAPPQFQDVQGLIGLSYPEIAKHQPTFIQTLIKNNIIKNYAYGMNLNLIQKDRSFVTFGDKDPNLFFGQMRQYPIGHEKQIKINFNWIKIGKSKKMKMAKALLDTGNTCISISNRYEQDILKAFQTANNKCAFSVQENVPMFSLLICKVGNFSQLPTLTLNIGGTNYHIQKQFYLQRCAQNPQQKNRNISYCDTYIQSVKYEQDMIFLGDGFFNRFYTFFDLENQKIGIARNRENITIEDIKSQEYEYVPEDWTDLTKEI